MGQTKVMDCKCNHNWQDKTYGKNNRIFIRDKQGNYSCSVCGKSRIIAATITKKNK